MADWLHAFKARIRNAGVISRQPLLFLRSSGYMSGGVEMILSGYIFFFVKRAKYTPTELRETT